MMRHEPNVVVCRPRIRDSKIKDSEHEEGNVPQQVESHSLRRFTLEVDGITTILVNHCLALLTASYYFNLLINQLLVVLVDTRQLECICQDRFAFFHASNHVRAAEPVGLS